MVENIFLFPGQGTQFVGMGRGILAARAQVTRERLDRISGILQRDLGRLMAQGPEEALKETSLSQPAITLVNLSAWEILGEGGCLPDAVAGFSLGEFSALAAAGVLSADQVLDLVTRRGLIMEKVCRRLADESRGRAPGMAAVVGLSPEQVEQAVEAVTDLYAVNFNSPRQTVVAGTAEALAAAEETLKAAGAKRVLPLKVAGPFHSPLMAPAAREFAAALQEICPSEMWKNPRIPIFSNVTGKPVTTGEEAAALAVEQITSPVRWTTIEEGLLALNPQSCREVGPGRVLAGLWKQMKSPVPCIPVGDAAEA